MTKKEEFEKQGFDVIEGREIIDEEQNHLLEFLKNNYPSIYKDGEINIEELKRVLNSKSAIGYKENGYGLNFIGRNLAKAKYRQKTKKELSINEKLSKNFDETENIIIKGDNLDSLKILKKYYSGKIKCIYIDPPYNTNTDNFLYPDKFDEQELEVLGLQDIGKEEYDRMEFIFKKSKKSHNGWLTFMYPRLKLARDLLTDDGAIFISIDDNEQANLKLLCDEIFGEDNFVYQLSVVDKLNGNDNSSGMMETEEYCLIYAKHKSKFKIGVLNIDEYENEKWQKDDLGYWKEGGGIKATGEESNKDDRKYLFFPIYIDEEKLTFSLEKDINHSYELLPISDGVYKRWTWSKEKFINEKDEVIIKKVGDSYSLYKKQRPALGDMPTKRGKTTFYSSQYSTANSNKNIKDLFDNKKVFNYSKSKYLIKDFIHLSNINKNDIVLDFFAGSGTTAHAVMELNAEDGGNRKFILCQIDEEIKKEKSAAYDFCIDNNFEPVISSITVERVNRAGDKILKTLKESNDMFDDKKIDIGYKVFDLHDVNIEKEDENKQIILLLNGVTDLSRIYNMIINIGLNSPVSKLTPIIENCAYMIEEDNIKRYYITNSEILIKNDENKQKFKDMIETGMVYIDGWTVTINVSLQQYKDNVKIVL
ncbi:site-specific DNA-methyltransferase [Brachyspira alvinipulli]|uniref:site-specific DNA-methyltransferase n=1 Tax=Brachyspira alvinipulli TaxID=84379 RepID=UPI000483FD62|nr:site-specific DNA-methyltransferase [Brachyspira alvinipulli]